MLKRVFAASSGQNTEIGAVFCRTGVFFACPAFFEVFFAAKKVAACPGVEAPGALHRVGQNNAYITVTGSAFIIITHFYSFGKRLSNFCVEEPAVAFLPWSFTSPPFCGGDYR